MEKVEVREVSKVQDANLNLCDGPWVHAGKRRKSWRRVKDWEKGDGYSHRNGQKEEGICTAVSGAGEEEARSKDSAHKFNSDQCGKSRAWNRDQLQRGA